MADKKLTDLPLVTGTKTDEIYAVRNGDTDVRVKLGDVILDKVRQPINSMPTDGAGLVSLRPVLDATEYMPIYSGVPRLERQFQVTLSNDVDFSSPVYSGDVDGDSVMIGVVLEKNTEYIWRCRDITVEGTESEWSIPTGFTTTNIDIIAAPELISPANGATGVAYQPELIGSEYSTTMPEYVRVGRVFQLTLSSDVDFLDPIIVAQDNSDSYQITTDLAASGSYIWRCKDIGVLAGDYQESAWSDVFSFEVKAGEVLKPSVVVPNDGAENVFSKIVKSSEFAISGGSDSFAGSEWEFYDIGDNLVHSSGLVSDIQYEYPDMSTLTTYKVRVKHVGVSYGESEWSDFVEFTTGGFISEPYSYLSIAHYNSPFVTIYKRSGDTFTKLASPSELPASDGYGASFSPDGNYLAIAHDTTPYVTIYKRSGDTFTKLANPSQLPAGAGRGASFSPDGNYLAIAHYITPFVTIYKRSGDTFTKLANPSELPAGHGRGASFSPDGNYLAIVHSNSPYVTIYKRSGDTFTKLANPSQLPPYTGNGASFSPDGNYLAIAHNDSPYVTIYKRSGDTFTKLANPSQLPTGSGYGASFSPDGNYLSIVHFNTPYVTIYKRNGDTFTKLANPSPLPASTGRGASFSPDGNYLSIAHNNSPYVTIYKRNGDTFDKVDDPLELPTGTGYGISSSPTMYTTPPPPPPTPGSIGTPGYHGFGVGTCTNEDWLTELGLSEMEGTNDYMHDNYGNYIHENTSQMVFIPKFYYRIGNPSHPKYSIFGANSLEIVGIETYETEAEANADGFILHRAFIDGGQEKIGFFIDKYHLSKKSDDPNVAVSVRYGVPISLTNDTNYTNSNGMPNCTGIYADSLELCKARGPQYNQCSAFALSALAMLSLAHGQYAETSDACAWFDPTYTTNFPKGCNNNALGDVNDPTLTFISAGDSGTANKPQCGSANDLAKTTHNGQNSGVADLNGAMYDLGLGITNFGTSATSSTTITNATLYVLKESVALASLTSGWNNPTDAWQSSDNIDTLYDQFTSQIALGTAATVYWGNGTNPVFPTDLSGNNRAICGILGTNDSSFSASGTNMFGNDYFYKYNRHNMFVRFGGSWSDAADAGVFYRYLYNIRSNASNYASSRGIAYGT